MDESNKKEKQDYVISRLTEAMSASAAGEDVFQRLAELDASDELQIRKAELLFGNRDSYLKEIDKIIANSHLTLTCNGCKDAVEHVAGEIVEFVDNARKILEQRNPFRKEREAFVRCQNCTEEEFSDSWEWLNKSLQATYLPNELSTEFYNKEFSATFPGSTSYSLTRFELLRDWERQLLIKEIDFELNMLFAPDLPMFFVKSWLTFALL